MTSTESKEPKGSEHSSSECPQGNGPHCRDHGWHCCHCGVRLRDVPEKPELRCKCGHGRYVHNREGCGATGDACTCQVFVCDHSACGWKPREKSPSPIDCPHIGSRDIESGADPDRWTRFHCDTCGATWIRYWEGPEDPLLTPEEEEELAPADDWHCTHRHGCSRLLEDVCRHGCRDAADALSREANEMEGRQLLQDPDFQESVEQFAQGEKVPLDEPPPPQPERRPPYAVHYSVQGHLFEMALPGDATVKAVDGALVILHHLGPVAGIVQVLPVINKEGSDG